MNISAFWGGFVAVVLTCYILYRLIRRKFQHILKRFFGTADVIQVLSQLDLESQETPRSLNGCDRFLLPQILKDFPDYDQNLAKTYVRCFLAERFGQKESFTIHNIVIARYLPSAVQKCIVFQAAVSWKEDEKNVQKRFDLHYSYIICTEDPSVAANCPNCGGVLGFGETVCPYCSSRVTNVLGNSWKFTQITET